MFLALLVLVGGWSATRALSARSHLEAAQAEAQTLRTAMSQGDEAGSRRALANVQHEVAEARRALNDPTLKVASHLPLVGHNVMAPRVVGHVLYDISRGPLPELVKVSGSMAPAKILPGGGRVDLDTLEAAEPGLTKSSAGLQDARRRMHNIKTDFTLGPISSRVAQATKAIDDAASATKTGAILARLGPTMLDGNKTYLLVFQNNAEARATGGMPGAWAELKANNGKISLGRQGTATEIPQFDKPVVELTEDEEYVFTDKLGTWFSGTTFTPDWPRAAEIAAQMIKDHNGLDVDGVVSVDPVAMSYLLRGTGPVKPAVGDTLTPDNVIDTIFNSTYLKYPENKEQDAYFAAATVAVFNAITSPSINAEALGKGLGQAGSERRLLVWSEDEDLQRELTGTAVAGEAKSGPSDRPQLGLYMADVRGSKMEYYLTYDAKVEATKCTTDEKQTFHAELTFSSSAPPDAANLPAAITGGPNRAAGLRPDDITLALNFFGPHEGEVLSVSTRGEPRDKTLAAFAPAKWEDRAVGQSTITLKPGETKTIDVVMASGPGADEDADVTLTPGSKPNKPSAFTVKSAC